MKKPRTNKKILIIGAGSIGCRHAANLSSLGCDIAMHDVSRKHLAQVCSEHHYIPVFDVESAIRSKEFDAAIVCTPNNQHISSAMPAVESGMDIFIEKPLSDSMDGVEDLLSAVRKTGCIAMAGFNLRFEPGLAYLKKKLNPSLVAFARIEFGFYLADWRKGVDYRKIYSANKSMGGGIILDDVHEIDYACWLMGYPTHITSAFGTYGNLEIDVEDVADLQLFYPDKQVSIHMDYLQKRYARNAKICMKDGGLLEWTYGNGVLEYNEEGNSTHHSYASSFDPNMMYLQEISTFVDCISNRIQPESGLENAVKVLDIALQAKK